jgi:hypothetical protein
MSEAIVMGSLLHISTSRSHPQTEGCAAILLLAAATTHRWCYSSSFGRWLQFGYVEEILIAADRIPELGFWRRLLLFRQPVGGRPPQVLLRPSPSHTHKISYVVRTDSESRSERIRLPPFWLPYSISVVLQRVKSYCCLLQFKYRSVATWLPISYTN